MSLAGSRIVGVLFLSVIGIAIGARASAAPPCEVAVAFSSTARKEPLTGRLLIAFARTNKPGPIAQTSPTGAPLFAIDVSNLAPDSPAKLDSSAFGHPIESLAGLPKGHYFVQACFNVYTEVSRGDGKKLWVHWDQGEGQQWQRSPGNLLSTPLEVDIDPAVGFSLKLECNEALPKLEPRKDSDLVKHVTVTSERLSKFWGREVSISATVLLPHGFAEHPDASYPVCYSQGHFSSGSPGGYGRNAQFTKWWDSVAAPRFLLVTFQHATPFYDDSYAVNSANNGPYGDALVMDLVPEVEKRFRAIGQPWARTLTGGSTGGWECLALQIFYPDFFNGCWSLCPDSLDFRSHQIVNVYDDDNAYFVDKGFTRVERPCRRRTDGSIEEMMKDENRYELVVGDKTRSGGQWDGWESVFSPVGDDGYPKRIWDKYSGKIDHEVAKFWQQNYDLRFLLESHWTELAPKLKGRLHVYVGTADDYFLNNGVKRFEAFLKKADPAAEGTVEYGDGRGHCYGPDLATLLPEMAKWIAGTAPPGTDVSVFVSKSSGR